MKRRVMNEGIPSLHNHKRRGGDNAAPLIGREQQADEDEASDDESVNVDEVPNSRDADCVAIAWRTNDWGDIARVIFCRPNAVTRDFEGSEPDPFTAWCAPVIEVKPRVVVQNRQTATNQQHHKEEIEEMAVADPEREAMRPGKIARVDLRDWGNMWQTCDRDFNPGRSD